MSDSESQANSDQEGSEDSYLIDKRIYNKLELPENFFKKVLEILYFLIRRKIL